jgi:aspartate aminotransferase
MSATARPRIRAPLNPAIAALKPSSTLAINERSRALQAQGRTIYRLGFGQSPFPVPPPAVEALRANAHRKDYLPVRGLAELRGAVAEHHRRVDGIECSAEDVLVGPGSKELMFLLALVCDADILIPSPGWVSYAPQARMAGRKVTWIPTTRGSAWRLTPEALDEAASTGRQSLLILNYPNNPSGQTYSSNQLAELAEAARRRGVLVLSDEIYGRLNYTGGHVSIARHYPEGTILSSGLSKWCGAGGWRLGTFIVPANLRSLLNALAACASETYTTASAPVQWAAVCPFEDGPEIDSYLSACRRILASLGRWTAARLRESGVHAADPEGGFYVFPDFGAHAETLEKRGITTSVQMCERLLEETGVALLPGADFGRPESELTARLCFVDFDGGACLQTQAREPAGGLSSGYLKSNCGRVTEAIEIICSWLR